MKTKALIVLLIITILSILSISSLTIQAAVETPTVQNPDKVNDVDPKAVAEGLVNAITTENTNQSSQSTDTPPVGQQTTMVPATTKPSPKVVKNVPEKTISPEDTTNPENLDEQIKLEKKIIIVIQAFAKHYGTSEDEAAELIFNMMDFTISQGGSVEITENGSILFDNKVTIEVQYNGTILMNGVDIIAAQAEHYNLTLEDSVELIDALFQLTQIDKHFKIVKSDENGVIFEYSIITEITKDGVLIMDGQIVETGEVEEAKDEIKEAAKDEIKTSANENANQVKTLSVKNSGTNNELPKTGENKSDYITYFGVGIILLGLLLFLHKSYFSREL